MGFLIDYFLLSTRSLWSINTIFDRQLFHLINMKSSAVTKCDHLPEHFFSQKRKWINDFCWQPHLLLKLVFRMIRLSRHINLREQDYGTKWHRFWLCLHYTVIFISNVQIPALLESELIVDLNSNCHDCSVQQNREKVQWFLAGWYGRISYRWKKVIDDETWLHMVSFVNHL